MSAKLEGMIADVVTETAIEIRISRHSAQNARISKVNGVDVCAPRAQTDVARLQRAFEAHPSNYYVVGPAFASMANPGGRRYQFDLGWLFETGQIGDECPPILVSALG